MYIWDTSDEHRELTPLSPSKAELRARALRQARNRSPKRCNWSAESKYRQHGAQGRPHTAAPSLSVHYMGATKRGDLGVLTQQTSLSYGGEPRSACSTPTSPSRPFSPTPKRSIHTPPTPTGRGSRGGTPTGRDGTDGTPTGQDGTGGTSPTALYSTARPGMLIREAVEDADACLFVPHNAMPPRGLQSAQSPRSVPAYLRNMF